MVLRATIRRCSDENAALAEMPRLLLVGFLERQRARRPAPAVQKFPLAINLDFDAPFAMVAELAVQLPAILPDRPEVFSDPRLTRRDLAFGRVEGADRSTSVESQGYCLSAVKRPALPASVKVPSILVPASSTVPV
jgi:hypothetical protein